MKKIFILSLMLLCYDGLIFSQTTFTWTGAGTTNDFSELANWSTSTVAAGPGDDIVFDGTSSKNCDFDIDIDVRSISVNSGYTGIVNGLSGSHLFRGDFSLASGTFSASSSDMTISGSVVRTGGTFAANGGLVTFRVNDLVPTSISGTIVFSDVLISDIGLGSPQRTVDFGTNTTINNLTLSGGSARYGYLGSVNILSSLVISGSNTGNPSPNSGTFTFSGAGPITITGASNSTRNKLPNLVFNTTGNISMTGNINLQGNWTGTQGTVSAGSSTANFYGTSASISGTAAAFNNLVIQSGASVSMPTSAEVKIGGSLTMTGTLNFQTTSALGLNGTGAQSIALGGKTLAAINAYNTGSARAVTLSGAIVILDSLRAEPNVTINTGGNLTLRSNASQTARIGRLGGSLGGIISGNVTVETFIPGGFTGWANLGVRGVTGQSIASWDTYSTSAGANGIPMTCTGCAYSPTIIPTPFTSVQSWDEPSGTYSDLVSTDPINPGVGIWVYVGDGQTTTNGLTTINTGAVAQGGITVPVTTSGTSPDKGFNLVANPYPSPISTNSLFLLPSNTFDFSGSIYVYNADNSSYGSSAGGLSTGGLQTDIIPGGQGFYVEFIDFFLLGSGFLTFDESIKVTSAAPLLKSSSSSTVGQFFRLNLKGASDEDETVFRIHQNATPGYDRGLDAHKIFQTPGYAGYPGPYTKYTTISSKDIYNDDYSIYSAAPLTKNLNVPVLAKVSSSGIYTITAFDFNDFENCLVLIDKLDNSYHDLRVSPYVFTISDTTSTPRFELVLCKNQIDVVTAIEETKSSLSSININQDEQGAFVKTSFPQNTKATISVFNIMGQKLMEDIQVEGTVTNTQLNLNLHNQVVFIRVVSERENTTKKMVIH